MCKWGTTEIVEVTIPVDLSCTGKAFKKRCKIDKCIAPIVKALADAGIVMRGCCCGHGKWDGEITLDDGRVLIIRTWSKKRKWKYEVCEWCFREQRLAWSVKDELWKKVLGNWKDKTVCLECFLREADRQKIDVKKEDLTFFGWIGENINGDIILDMVETK